MFRRNQHQFAFAAAAAFCAVVIWTWGVVVLAAPLPLPHVSVPAVNGLLVRIESNSGWRWKERLEIDGDGSVRYFENEDGFEKLRGEGRLSMSQLEQVSQAFAIAEFCDGPRYVSPADIHPLASPTEWRLTYFACSPARMLRDRELPIRGWWWDDAPRLPWSVFEITGLSQHFRYKYKASY